MSRTTLRRLARLDRWLFQGFRAEPRGLGLFRIFFCLFVLATRVPLGAWTAELMAEGFQPPLGLPRLLSGFPGPGVTTALNVALAAAVLCLLAGWRARTASLAVGGLLIALNTICYSMGKINHDIFITLLPLLFAFSPWGDAWRLRWPNAAAPAPTRSARGSCVLALLSLLICVAMFQSGLAKATSGWLKPDLLCTLGYLVQTQDWCGSSPAGLAAWGFTATWFWKAADYGALAFELSMILGLFSRRRFLLLVSAATVFHFAVWLLFDIPFVSNLMAYAAFLDWSWAAGRLEQAGRALHARARFILGLGCWSASAGLAGWAIVRRENLTAALDLPTNALLILGAFALGAAYLLRPAAWALGRRLGLAACGAAAAPSAAAAPQEWRRAA